MTRIHFTLAVLTGVSSVAAADSFNWTVDSSASVLTTTISATVGVTLSDSETNHVAGFIGGELALPSFTFGTVHLTSSDLSYTTNPSFSLTSGFLGGVNIVGNGLGFAIPGANNLGFASPTPASVALNGAFSQPGNGAEGRGTLTYTGVGILGASVGSGTINLLDQSPLPMDFNGVLSQAGNVVSLTLPISIDQTTTQNNIPVRVQITGNVIARATTTANGWKADVSGDWRTQSNWVANSAIPGAAGQSTFDTAVFGPVITADRTVTVRPGSVLKPRRILVNSGSSGRAYLFAGTGVLGIESNANGSARIESQLGIARFDVPVVLQSDTTIVAGAVDSEGGSLRFAQLTSTNSSGLVKRGLGTMSVQRLDVGNVEIINRGIANVSDGQSVSKVRSLTIYSGAYFDVGDGALIVDNGAAPVLTMATNSTLANIKLAADANWALGGITSSQIVVGEGTALGYGTMSTTGLTAINGVALGNTSLVVRYTSKGDINLDQAVDFTDLLGLAQHFGSAGLWFEGDFNYDAQVGFDDLLALAQNYGTPLSAEQAAQLPAGFAQDFALAQSMVPEPMMLALLPLALSTRRRR